MHQLALQVKSLFKAVIMLTCQIIVWLPLAPIFPTRWFWGVVKWSLSRVSQTSDSVLFTSSLQWWLCCIQDVPNQQNDHIYVTPSQKEPEVFRWMTCTFFVPIAYTCIHLCWSQCLMEKCISMWWHHVWQRFWVTIFIFIILVFHVLKFAFQFEISHSEF